jgi:hypothetical protein
MTYSTAAFSMASISGDMVQKGVPSLVSLTLKA